MNSDGAAPEVGEPEYLFILNPAHCGSTALAFFLLTSPVVAAVQPRAEGLFLPDVKGYFSGGRWKQDKELPWPEIKKVWLKAWRAQAAENPALRILLDKSPPNMVRAAEIEKHFPAARFVILVRDPYAWCGSYVQGQKRKEADYSAKLGKRARGWLGRAKLQRDNAQSLQHSILVTYEEFADFPSQLGQRLIKSFPNLSHLDSEVTMELKNYEASAISNHNERQIGQLTQDDIELISGILAENLDLVEFFGYKIRDFEETPT